jgi:hypothetical protein
MTTDVEVSRVDGAQLLRLARPEKKNALTGAMYSALCDAIEKGDADSSIAAHVIIGSGGTFTAGNDLGDFLATSRGTGVLGTDVLRFVRLLPVIRKPVIAAVDGNAIGIGTTLLFHCDLVYATPGSTFATPFLDLGLIPEAASSLLMPMRMGYARAFEMLVLGAATPPRFLPASTPRQRPFASGWARPKLSRHSRHFSRSGQRTSAKASSSRCWSSPIWGVARFWRTRRQFPASKASSALTQMPPND